MRFLELAVIVSAMTIAAVIVGYRRGRTARTARTERRLEQTVETLNRIERMLANGSLVA